MRLDGDPHKPYIIAGFSGQDLGRQIANNLQAPYARVQHSQFRDGEIKPVLDENLRRQEAVVVSGAAGEPSKQEKESRLLMGAASNAGVERVTFLQLYQVWGRGDGRHGQRVSPALSDSIETLRSCADAAIICDPHNPLATELKYLDRSSRTKTCASIHFAFPYAVQIASLIQAGVIEHDNILFAHADSGAGRRIDDSFRQCMYEVLGFPDRDPHTDGWPFGVKHHHKKTEVIKVGGFTGDPEGCDVIIFEDIIDSASTIIQNAKILKERKARSVIIFGTHCLATTEKGDDPLATIDRINESPIDVIYTADAYSYARTNPEKYDAIQESPIIHTIGMAGYLSLIISATHADVEPGLSTDHNSVGAILRGAHPEQRRAQQTVARPAPPKASNRFFGWAHH